MNRIKFISIVSIVLALFSCSKDDYRLDTTVDPFVRFNFMVNSNNIPIEYPVVNTTTIPIETYENQSVRVLKIPVSLTSKNLKEAVTVNFSSSTSGDSNSFSVEPKNTLRFEGTKLTDTIYLSFEKRWTDKQSITLQLENASDPEIHIGNLNSYAPNKTFTVNLGSINTVYTFPVSQLIVKGEVGETIDFKVNFPNGFIPSEIENANIFKFQNGFEYSLTHDDYGTNRSSITYHLTLLEDIQNDDARYESKITLVNTPNYIATGSTGLTIVKPIKSPRDIQANPASKFTDPTNAFYLTYGEHWFNNNGNCTWQTFNALTFPVVVTKDNENAILYSDKGTANPNDDVYHDAFKIGFNVASGTNTVNSFGLKRWFSNESNSAAISPGFNITSALEFFPANGTSKTEGTVLVIPQDITIGSSATNTHVIAISGEGTYKEISAGLYEISFELKLTNDKLFGGTVSTQYRMYNNRTYPKPAALSISCPKEVTL
ncbi:hypothetical protein [Flavobacterium quisquiliarum]|uniref:DUF1735 domain-containing protein n=1 Tax=Flavobacterium quisquiliarum TaxID=1834436 RepID=A0ABV8VYP0_9FLAO|nr:hypothetical protein [Flavobacterium quisquiliarum]MBW1655773.1 hypothetical protein [Flavobacterium quisquiliarum]NWL01480.1 hypothetical protein [Flavobacterium collinsii]